MKIQVLNWIELRLGETLVYTFTFACLFMAKTNLTASILQPLNLSWVCILFPHIMIFWSEVSFLFLLTMLSSCCRGDVVSYTILIGHLQWWTATAGIFLIWAALERRRLDAVRVNHWCPGQVCHLSTRNYQRAHRVLIWWSLLDIQFYVLDPLMFICECVNLHY